MLTIKFHYELELFMHQILKNSIFHLLYYKKVYYYLPNHLII